MSTAIVYAVDSRLPQRIFSDPDKSNESLIEIITLLPSEAVLLVPDGLDPFVYLAETVGAP